MLIVLLLVAVLMVLTRPSVDDHKAKMLKAVKEYVEEETKPALGVGLFAKIGQNIVMKTVGILLDTKLEEHNYLLFNTTSVNLDGEDQILSVGALGYVYTFDKEMLREKLEPALKRQADERKETE